MLCTICLRSGQQMRLSKRDMSSFYAICYTDFEELQDVHEWLCTFCWTRVSQCILFITTARQSKMLLSVKCHSFEPVELHTYEKTHMSTFTLCEEGCQKNINIIYHENEERKCINNVKEPTVPALKQENDLDNIFTVKLEYITKDDSSTYREECSKDDESHSDATDHNLEDSTLEDTLYLAEQPQVEDAESWDKYLKMLEEKRRSLGLELVLLTEKEQKREIFKLRRTVRFETAKFKCKMCAITFHTESDLSAHLNIHNGSAGRHKCDICKCHFSSSLELYKHRSSHERRWRCSKCQAILGEGAALSKRGYRCRKKMEERYVCEECSKKFTNSTRLLYHVRKEHQPQNLRCEKCPYKTAIRKHYLRHLLIHRKKETSFTCMKCDEPRPTFRAAGFLNRHIEKMHDSNRTSDPPEDCYCPQCDKVYKSKKALEVHFKMAKAHLSEGYKWVCAVCSKKFQTSSNLKLHMQLKHEQPKEHHCPICNKAFSALPYVTKHVNRTHKAPERERPRNFMCDICGSAFKSKCFLKNHVVGKHLKLRPYACPLCPATFSYNGVLHTHVTQVHHVKYTRDFVATSSSRD